MDNIINMTDEERNIYFMQKFRHYKSNEEYKNINCILQYPSWCKSCWWRQTYTSIWGVCIDQVIYSYFKQTGNIIDISRLNHRVSHWQNIYTI